PGWPAFCAPMECAICRERSSSRMLRAELRQSSDSRPRRHRSLALAGTPRCAAVYRCRWPALTRRERYSGCRLTALPKVDLRIAHSTAWALADSARLGIPTARVHLDHLRLYADRYAVTSEAAKKSIKRCRQRHGANFGDHLTLPNCITDAGFCTEDAIEGCVDVAVAGM